MKLTDETLKLIQTLPGLYFVRDQVNEQIDTIEKSLGIGTGRKVGRPMLPPEVREKRPKKDNWYANLSPERKREILERGKQRRRERLAAEKEKEKSKSQIHSENRKKYWASLPEKTKKAHVQKMVAGRYKKAKEAKG